MGSRISSTSTPLPLGEGQAVGGLLYIENLVANTAWHHDYNGHGNVTHLTDPIPTNPLYNLIIGHCINGDPIEEKCGITCDCYCKDDK